MKPTHLISLLQINGFQLVASASADSPLGVSALQADDASSLVRDRHGDMHRRSQVANDAQASSDCAITQIGDGQIQAPASCYPSAPPAVTPPPVHSATSASSAPSEGTPQGPASSTNSCAITQIGDGQIQAPASCYPSTPPPKTSPPSHPVTSVSSATSPPVRTGSPLPPHPHPSSSASPTVPATPIASEGTRQSPASSTNSCAITQIGDGQIQAPASCYSTASSTVDTSKAGSASVPAGSPRVSHAPSNTPSKPTPSGTNAGSLSSPAKAASSNAPSPSGNCVLTQIGDGQVQAPASCYNSGKSPADESTVSLTITVTVNSCPAAKSTAGTQQQPPSTMRSPNGTGATPSRQPHSWKGPYTTAMATPKAPTHKVPTPKTPTPKMPTPKIPTPSTKVAASSGASGRPSGEFSNVTARPSGMVPDQPQTSKQGQSTPTSSVSSDAAKFASGALSRAGAMLSMTVLWVFI